MNASFRAAAAQFISKAPPRTHKQEVCKLYRDSLRLLESWAVSRNIFIREATALRARFDEGAKCEPYQVDTIMKEAYKEMEENTHVDPYVRPYMPSGTSFMRNPAIPLDICYPDGIPQEVLDEFKDVGTEREIDMSMPEDGRMSRAGRVLVDYATKRVY